MTKAEAEALGDELWKLVRQGPGSNDDGLSRVAEIERALCRDPNASPYVREKVLSAAQRFAEWFSPQRWQRMGEDRLRGILNNEVGKVQMAIMSDWPEGTR